MITAAISPDPLIWLGAFLTLCVFSFLYRDNVFYQLAEHLMVGLSAGYYLNVLYWNVFKPNVIDQAGQDIAAGQWFALFMTIFVALLGLLMLSRLPIPFLRPVGWVSRWPMALAIGISSGMAIPTTLEAYILRQVAGGVSVSVIPGPGVPWHLALGAIVLVLGTITALIYFFFSLPHRGVVGAGAKIGIWVLMIGFGASFGYTVMGRLSLLIGRVLFLLKDWLGLITF
jgi:hypothetical protein